MLTSKERAELRSQANTLETTLMVGKGGVTDAVIAEADNQLTTRELVMFTLQATNSLRKARQKAARKHNPKITLLNF